MVLTNSFHFPVLRDKVIANLNVSQGKKYIDATVGGGGYTYEIVKQGGIVLGIDRDGDAIEFVKDKFTINKEIFLEQGNFRDIRKIAENYGFIKVAGIIFDLGISDHQLHGSKRGFSYKGDEPLDMRMDLRQKLTAGDIINKFSKDKLYEIFTKFGEELNSRSITEAVFRARALNIRINTTGQLVKIIQEATSNSRNKDRIFARIFQALRIAVNDELADLRIALRDSIALLETRGILEVISFHSLEDRVTKQFFNNYRDKGVLKIISRRPIRAFGGSSDISKKEEAAKLRIAEKRETNKLL